MKSENNKALKALVLGAALTGVLTPTFASAKCGAGKCGAKKCEQMKTDAEKKKCEEEMSKKGKSSDKM